MTASVHGAPSKRVQSDLRNTRECKLTVPRFMLRFEDLSTKEFRAYNVYTNAREGLPIGIIRDGLLPLHGGKKPLLFATLFDWLRPNSQELTEIAKFMVEHDL